MAELGDFSSDSGVSDGTVSVDMCDYGFVDECNDKKKLQGILNLLLSGKEGHYPELIKHTEDKLLTLMTPAEQLKTLRLKKEITPMERIEAESGLSDWESLILSADKSLSRKQGQTLDHVGSIDLHTLPMTTSTKYLPPVRGASTPLEVSGTKTENSSECEGVINRKRLSDREKLKGNEFYRVGEVEEAVRCYTRSINFDPTNHILYANRAMGFIKLDALEKAEEDCSKALQIDCTYVKAWSRRGLTRFKRGKYSLSASDFTNALKLDPNNKDIPQLLQKSKDKYLEVEGKGEWKEDDLINKNVIKDPVFIVVTNTAVSRDEFISFFPPQGHCDCLTHGVYERRNSSEIAPTETAFARIPITFDDDDDDDDEEDDEEMQDKIKEDKVVVSNGSSGSSRHVEDTGNQGVHVKLDTVVEKEVKKEAEKEEDATIYTRITITDEDEEEEEDEEASVKSSVEAEFDTFSRERNGHADRLAGAVKGEMSGDTLSAALISMKGSDRVENEVIVDDQFTRIAIVDDDDDDNDDDDNGNAHVVVNDEQTLHRSNTPQDISETQKGVVKMAEQGISSTTAAALTEKKVEVATTAAAFTGHKQFSAAFSTEKCKMKVGISGEEKREKEVVKKERGAFEQGEASSKSETLKAAGNEAMKSLDYKSALSLYTASLELDQSNLLTRNNRAQTHLKLLNFKEAVTDATYVIEKDPSYPGTGGLPTGVSLSSVSSAVKKALYRRATAYTSLGGDLLLAALKDLDLLLSFEPGNTLAHSERTKVAIQVRDYQAKKGNTAHVDVVKGAPKKGTGALGPSVSGSGQVLGGSSKGGEMMAERSSRRITAASKDLTNPSGLPSVAPLSSTQVPSIVQPALPPPPPPLVSTSIAPATNIPVKKPFKREPSVPSEVPKTLYEFERAWRGLKDRPDLFAQYLRQNIHEKSVIRKVFKESISPDLLSATFISLRDHCTAIFSLPFLLSLSSVRHFSMTLALLQEEDLICVRSIVNSVCIQREHKESINDIKIGQEKEKEEEKERDDLGDEVRDIIEQLKLLYKL